MEDLSIQKFVEELFVFRKRHCEYVSEHVYEDTFKGSGVGCGSSRVLYLDEEGQSGSSFDWTGIGDDCWAPTGCNGWGGCNMRNSTDWHTDLASGEGKGYEGCDGIDAFCGKPVYYDFVIEKVISEDTAIGFRINQDLTTTPGYIVKDRWHFKFGATLEEARENLKFVLSMYDEKNDCDMTTCFIEKD